MFCLLIGFCLLLVVLLFNTFRFESKQNKEQIPQAQLLSIPEGAYTNLSEAVQIPTINYTDTSKIDYTKLLDFHEFLKEKYPLVHQNLSLQKISEYSLLYKWQGQDNSAKPFMLIAHQDVVPIEDESLWDYPPFSGKIANGFIYGRGSLDDKLSILGALEAVEQLLKEGYQPQKTLYLGFGHDEETLGSGAKSTADYLKSQNIQLEFLLDEGSVTTDGIFPGLDSPVALLGITEKGFANVEIIAKGQGGHSSMPPKKTAVGVLSKIIYNLQQNPMPQKMEGATGKMFDYIGPELSFFQRLVFANRWLTAGILKRELSKSPTTDATTRTTTAPTMLQGSIKENVLASKARGVVNFRILPGETDKDIIQHIKKHSDGEDIEINVLQYRPASPVSNADSKAFKAIKTSVQQICQDCIIAPSLVIAATDASKYADVADDIYRYLPVQLKSEDLKRIHGSNERISKENYALCIQFYYQLIKNANL